ncbi:TlpA family protein disulfide reductase [Prolixibacteraceae bacterium JC049]|nr:TlpA family protein disulfide reductase [Prolixibacteraceae bacterium JC049]
MEKTNLILILFFILISCGKQGSQNYVIITGKVNITNAKFLVINNKTDTFEIKIDSAQSFHDTISIEQGYYTLSINKKSFNIYLKPGFQIDVKIGKQIEFNGKGSNENNYLEANRSLVKKLKDVDNYKYYAKRQEESFLLLMDSIYQNRLHLLDKIRSEICNEFKYIEESKLKYEYQRKKALYEISRKIVTGDNNFKVSKSYYFNLYKGINVNDSNLIIVNDYIRFVDSYLWQEANSIVNGDSSIDFYLTYMSILNERIEAKKLKEKLSYDIGNIKLPRTKKLDQVYKLVTQNISNKRYLNRVQKKYNILKRIEKGAMSPDFQFEDKSGKLIGLKDLKGKIIYIDIWATGCGPCIAEIPFQKKLEKRYKDKNIHFVGINIDQTVEEWKKTVKEKKLKGIQLYAANTKASFFKDYVVQGIPRYILLNKNGRIIESYAKRPSDRELIEQLDKIILKNENLMTIRQLTNQ